MTDYYLKEFEEARKAAVRAKKKYLAEALRQEAKKYVAQLGGCADHEAYREKVVPYWERFGYVPEEFWFELTGSRDQVIDPWSMPLDLLYNEIVPYLNNLQLAGSIADKSYYRMWFPDAKQPRMVCCRVAGIFYDENMELVSEAEALKLCMDRAGLLFVKPSIYTHSGRGISAADVSEMSSRELEEIFEKTGMNFIVQEAIKQHPDLAVLNPDSVNTIRITSLLMDGEVHIVSESMRVSSPGERVPHHGNRDYYTQILGDGSLHEKALLIDNRTDEKGEPEYDFSWAVAKESGLYDDDYRVPCMPEIRKLAKKLHSRIARLRFIGWDFTVDEEGDPVLIELNLSPGMVTGQISIGSPMFGDMTDRVLEDFFIKRSLENVQKQGLLVQ